MMTVGFIDNFLSGMACGVLIILIFLLHIYVWEHIITDLDWFYRDSIIIFWETLLGNIDVDLEFVWR
jgi:hypothetical protein